MKFFVFALAMLVPMCVTRPALAQPAPAETRAEAPAAAAAVAGDIAGTKRALILCGMAGDDDHRKLFGDSIETLYAGLTNHHGFAAEHVHVYWGDEAIETDGPAVQSSRGITSGETLTAATAALQAELQPNDTLWVFVFGHAHYDGRFSWLNISGTDINHQEFGALFQPLRCREQVFFLTTSSSGFFTKPLAAPSRVVISATEPDLEVNETLFPHKLVALLGPTPPPYLEFEADGDGRLTVLDLYLLAARQTAQDYATNMLLATEHSLLDDNGDGRGTELQIDYLPEELGGRLKAGQEPPALKGDGLLARRLHLSWPPSPPVPDLTAE